MSQRQDIGVSVSQHITITHTHNYHKNSRSNIAAAQSHNSQHTLARHAAVIFAIILYSLLPHPDLNKQNANIAGLSQNEDGSRVSREVSGQLDIMSL